MHPFGGFSLRWFSGRGVAQRLAHLVRDQGVGGSNPLTPTRKLFWVGLWINPGNEIRKPLSKTHLKIIRGVAQPGSAVAWGAKGCRFKSCRPDHFLNVFFWVPEVLQFLPLRSEEHTS